LLYSPSSTSSTAPTRSRWSESECRHFHSTPSVSCVYPSTRSFALLV
jgi:hypothetical protein